MTAVKHRLDEAGEDTPIVREQTSTADSEARQLRHRVWIPAAPQSGITHGKPRDSNSRLLRHASENAT